MKNDKIFESAYQIKRAKHGHFWILKNHDEYIYRKIVELSHVSFLVTQPHLRKRCQRDYERGWWIRKQGPPSRLAEVEQRFDFFSRIPRDWLQQHRSLIAQMISSSVLRSENRGTRTNTQRYIYMYKRSCE